MATYIADPIVEQHVRAERRATGGDRYDEVWDGVYVIMPLPSNEHQELVSGMNSYLFLAVQATGLGNVFPGVNVSDRREGWQENYREPDIAVFLKGTRAENCGTHWLGGPDFAIEVVSPNDRSREKLDFYARLGVRELLLIDGDPWQMELFRSEGVEWVQVGQSTPDQPAALRSEVIPITWRLVPGARRPQIEMTQHDTGQTWTV